MVLDMLSQKVEESHRLMSISAGCYEMMLRRELQIWQ